jgi:DNA-binding NtrC family response regulator
MENLSSPVAKIQVDVLDTMGHIRSWQDIKAEVVEHALAAFGGHVRSAAEALRVGPATLYRLRQCGRE